MDATMLLSLLKDPSVLKSTDVKALEELVIQFPYFQTAHLLLLKKYQIENHPDFEKQLNITALYAVDRSKLFDWVQKNVDISDAPYSDLFLENELFLLNESGTVVELSPGFIPDDEKEELVEENDPEIQSVSTIEEEFILRYADPDLKEKQADKSFNMESAAQLKDENYPDRNEAFQKTTSSKISEDKWSREEVQDLKEDLLITSQNGSASEFFPMEIEEQNLVEDITEINRESDAVIRLESVTTEVPDKAKNITLGKVEEGFRINKQVQSPGQFLPQKSYTFQEWLTFFRHEDYKGTNKNIPQVKGGSEEKEITITPLHTLGKPDKLYLGGIQSELETIDKIVSVLKPHEALKSEKKLSPEDLAQKSLELDEEMISETLAEIYGKQGKYDKAIRMYARLSLKFPEKLSFFAARIKELKRNQQSG
ncbi:MAG: tetratricopeptide repeat-containing protein [Chitinophagales bacterium]|nr:tetratricopeptide repeat-containing protein [Chitinophagales bacterium]